MIELPEAITLGRQVAQTLAGKTVTEVYPATHLHKFTFFNDLQSTYRSMLVGRTVQNPCSRCGAAIRKEAYMGGSIYYCTACQK